MNNDDDNDEAFSERELFYSNYAVYFDIAKRILFDTESYKVVENSEITKSELDSYIAFVRKKSENSDISRSELASFINKVTMGALEIRKRSSVTVVFSA